MSRTSRIGSFAVVAAVVGALLLPISGASGAPTAHKSGAIVNYLSTGKIRIAKRMQVLFSCSVACNLVSTLKVKGPFVKGASKDSGSPGAGQAAEHFLKPTGPLLKLMKASPGRYKLVSHVKATDPATGAVDKIAHSFRLKR